MTGIKASEERPEVKAWMSLISLKNIPVNKKQVERLSQMEGATQTKRRKKSPSKHKVDHSAKAKADKADPTRGLLAKTAPSQASAASGKQAKEDRLEEEFLSITDLHGFDQELLDQQDESMQLSSFDVFTFESVLVENALSYMTYKVFRQYQFLETYFIEVDTLITFVKEVQLGYSKDNPYHNVAHVIDSLQGLHFMLSIAKLSKYLKKQDMFAGFLACLI